MLPLISFWHTLVVMFCFLFYSSAIFSKMDAETDSETNRMWYLLKLIHYLLGLPGLDGKGVQSYSHVAAHTMLKIHVRYILRIKYGRDLNLKNKFLSWLCNYNMFWLYYQKQVHNIIETTISFNSTIVVLPVLILLL